MLKEYNELNLENESYETLDDEKKLDNYFMITNVILNQQLDNLNRPITFDPKSVAVRHWP